MSMSIILMSFESKPLINWKQLSVQLFDLLSFGSYSRVEQLASNSAKFRKLENVWIKVVKELKVWPLNCAKWNIISVFSVNFGFYLPTIIFLLQFSFFAEVVSIEIVICSPFVPQLVLQVIQVFSSQVLCAWMLAFVLSFSHFPQFSWISFSF